MTPAPFVPRPTTAIHTFLPEFWSHIIRQAEQYQSDFKDGPLPLARIKKLVKSDPDIKMIANEVTVLLDKACEIFINEITARSFLVANSLNRRTVNLSDVAQAISQSDMFDFLIDIVPTELVVPAEDHSNGTGLPSTSAEPSLPTASSSKQRRAPNATEIEETPNDEEGPIEWRSVPVSQKKKKRIRKVNRNLLPEEIAVPIPDDELIQPEDPYAPTDHNSNSNSRILAIPIPDSELIPPRSSEPSWEMAIPITSNNHSVHSTQSRSWEMAVPITDSTSSTMPTHFEGAAQMTDHVASNSSRNSSGNPSHKRKRCWDLAVPILDEDHSLTKSEESLNNSSSSTSNHQRLNSKSTNKNQPRTWELSVPITSDQHVEQINYPRTNQSHSLPNHINQPVPIDPALFNLSPSIKPEPDSIDPHIVSPFDAQTNHQKDDYQPNHISIKREG